jgi:hypothetical protein
MALVEEHGELLEEAGPHQVLEPLEEPAPGGEEDTACSDMKAVAYSDAERRPYIEGGSSEGEPSEPGPYDVALEVYEDAGIPCKEDMDGAYEEEEEEACSDADNSSIPLEEGEPYEDIARLGPVVNRLRDAEKPEVEVWPREVAEPFEALE